MNSELTIAYQKNLIESLFFYLSCLLKKILDIIGISTQSPQSKLNVLGTTHAGTDDDDGKLRVGAGANNNNVKTLRYRRQEGAIQFKKKPASQHQLLGSGNKYPTLPMTGDRATYSKADIYKVGNLLMRPGRSRCSRPEARLKDRKLTLIFSFLLPPERLRNYRSLPLPIKLYAKGEERNMTLINYKN